MKKLLILFILSITFSLSPLFSQQLTRFAVIDLPKVYLAFFKDSRDVRAWEDKSKRLQIEIDQMEKEIKDLKSKQMDAVLQGNRDVSLKLENEIYKKSEFLKEYFTIKTAVLENERKKLMQSGSFLEQVYDEIRYIAESEGYSLVMNLNENPAIIWRSQSIDITDKVIQNLIDKARR